MDKIELKIPPLPFKAYQYANISIQKNITSSSKRKLHLITLGAFTGILLIIKDLFIEKHINGQTLKNTSDLLHFFRIASIIDVLIIFTSFIIFLIVFNKKTLYAFYKNSDYVQSGYQLDIKNDIIITKTATTISQIKKESIKEHFKWNDEIYFFTLSSNNFLWIPKELIENHPEKDQIYRQLHIAP